MLPELLWSFPDPAPQVVGTIQPSIEIPPIGPYLLPSPTFLAHGGDLWSPFVAIWMEFGGAKGGREQRGSKQVAWIESFSQIWGLFQGFGAFSGIRGLFWGFAAFSRIHGLFADSLPFHRFAAFSQIRSLFADLRIHSQGSEGSERATWRNFRYLIFLLTQESKLRTNTLTLLLYAYLQWVLTWNREILYSRYSKVYIISFDFRITMWVAPVL